MSDEYIRKQDAITAACKGFCHPGVRCPDEPCREQTKYLRDLPSADVVPVKHGRWSFYDLGLFKGYICSECNRLMRFKGTFCPHCGAKMDGEE